MRLAGLRYGIVISIALVTSLAWGNGENDDDPRNGLSSQAFRRNALTTNANALKILNSHPLNDALFHINGNYILQQLDDPNAQAMLREIVKCALDDQTSLSTTDPPAPANVFAKGELGLCQAWYTDAPNPACQEQVTACVMARVNALQKAVPLRLAELSVRYPSAGPVNTVKELREGLPDTDPAEGRPIPNFNPPCAAGVDCPWRSGYVGTCRGGDQVTLQVDAPVHAGWQVRVCAGIHGCTDSTTPLAAAGSPPYSWRIGKFPPSPQDHSDRIALSFSCPSEMPVGNYYSVMLRNAEQSGSALPPVHADVGVYPAPRKDVFSFLEGAYFGNLFLLDKLTRDCEVVRTRDDAGVPLSQLICRSRERKGATEVCPIRCGITSCSRDAGAVPYSNVHACYSAAQQQDSQSDDLGVAYINSRICDRPDANCFPEPPVPCTGDATVSARCSWNPATGGFTDCTTPADRATKYQPITTYLNEPCDLIGEGGLCDEVRRPHPHKVSGCPTWLCVLGGIFALIFLGVLVWRLRGRERSHGL